MSFRITILTYIQYMLRFKIKCCQKEAESKDEKKDNLKKFICVLILFEIYKSNIFFIKSLKKLIRTLVMKGPEFIS